MSDDTFAIGLHRPVYLWAGPGTVRMNRLKFMDAPVEEDVHAEAHTGVGAQRMAQEAGFNWAYLMYNWGFPPEVERQDWEDFCRAVRVYHDAGIQVFGYIQTSNCAYDGSFREKDWYARDPKGAPFYYYTGRFMTCWSHPEWLDQLRAMVRGIVKAGADGVFFDNPWHGTEPLHFGGAWMGSAGCYCARCQAAFRAAGGQDIPTRIAPASDEASRRYLRWRAEQVTTTLDGLADYARQLKPGVMISANDFDAVMRPCYLVHGIDLQALAQVQDVVMIEDFALPRWEGDLLLSNALTLRTARALIGDTPLSTNPYDQGIGFDGVYPGRRFRQAIAEAAACGAAAVLKGTEFVEDGTFTLLTAQRFAPQREAIGQFHRWLEAQAGLYRERENAAPVGLLHPGETLWWEWDRLAPLFFGVGQTLLAEGIPWRVVTGQGDLDGLQILFAFDKTPSLSGLKVVQVPDLAGWQRPRRSFLARHKAAHKLASGVVGRVYRAYFEWRWARDLGDRLGVTRLYMASPLFRLPPAPAREALLAALGERPYPHITSEAPVLSDLWRQGEDRQLHLVNYSREPQTVTVSFGQTVKGLIFSPDGHEAARPALFEGPQLELQLDVYAVLTYQPV